MPADASAPIQLDAATLAEAGGPIAAGLLPGWRVTWRVLSQEQLDTLDPELPGPNLAIVQALSERRLATINVVTPWPPGESLSETLHHEIGHAWLKPITAQIPDTPASVMLEEQLIETLGVYLASLSEGARAVARRALAPIVERYAPRLRARISARAQQARARGGSMDPKLIVEALDALIAGDAAKCQEILKGIIAASAAGGAAPATSEPPMEDAKLGTGGEEPMPEKPMEEARTYARKGADVETSDQKRARIAREEIESIAADARTQAIDGLVGTLRARLAGHDGLPAIEKRIAGAKSYAEAKTIADVAIEMGGGPARARSGVEHQTTTEPGGNGPAPFTAAQLEGEGIPAALAAEIVGQWSIPGVGKKLAEQTLSHARARLHGHSSPFMPKEPTHKGANGAGKAS